jgi:hypothetical protein
MKIIRNAIVSLVAILSSATLIHAQDLSKYRNLSLGTSLADVSKLTNKKPADAIVVHQRPALIQQLTWWPAPSIGGEDVQQIRFSFFNDKLYRILVTYDNASTRGLTPEDMMKAMTRTYGTASGSAGEIKDSYGTIVKVLARWEDSQYSLNLFQSSLSDGFSLVIIVKALDAQADDASVEAVKLEAQEAPDKELARVKKQADDLEAARQKNVEAFLP